MQQIKGETIGGLRIAIMPTESVVPELGCITVRVLFQVGINKAPGEKQDARILAPGAVSWAVWRAGTLLGLRAWDTGVELELAIL